MATEDLYKSANDRIRAPEFLKAQTIRKMEELREAEVYAQEQERASKAKVIPFRSHLIRTGIAVIAAAAMFFIAGRYLMPFKRSLPAGQDVASGTAQTAETLESEEVLTFEEQDMTSFLVASKGNLATDAEDGITLRALEESLADAAQTYHMNEPCTYNGHTVYLTRMQSVADDSYFYRAVLEKDGTVWLLSASGIAEDTFTDAIRAFLR